MVVAPAPVRKVVIDKAGSYDRMVVAEAAPLTPSSDEIVIDVAAIGVNYADCMVRMGLYSSAKEYVGWPITPGFEVSGVVRSVGDAVTDFAVGDRVMAVTLFNGYASQVQVKSTFAFPISPQLSFEQAAAFPAVFMTAYYALHELAHPRAGSTILIHSAAGGVGGALVQLAKRAGCTVVGVVGATHKVDIAAQHGADHVIDKSTQNLWAEAERLVPDGYDVICDANGVATLQDSYAHLRKSGKLVVYGFHTMIPKSGGRPNYLKLAWGWLRTPRFNPLNLVTDSKSVLAFNLSYLFDHTQMLEEAMTALGGWLADGSIQPPPVTTYPMAEVGRAHADIESGQTTGKLVLIP